MVSQSELIACLNEHVGRLLDVAEVALPPDRFVAFRRIVLREFGERGFAGDLRDMCAMFAAGRDGQGRGRTEPGGKGGAL